MDGKTTKTFIYASGELDKNSTCSILEHMGNDGKQRYATTYYNLDAIISVAYRVNSINATAFRRWATNVLREYLLQGYSVNRHLIALQENMDKRMTHIEDRNLMTVGSLSTTDFIIVDIHLMLMVVIKFRQ